jgi:hypothetical protein
MARKLNVNELKRMIAEEKANVPGAGESVEKRAKQTKEVEADGYAETLENKIDYMKALKIEARRLERRLNRINEALNETKQLKVVKE